MPPHSQRPDPSGRAACARLGASASCLLVILAANQAAARDAPVTLPYLVHAIPAALRFAAARPTTPPPPPFPDRIAEPVRAEEPSPAPAASAPPADAGSVSPSPTASPPDMPPSPAPEASAPGAEATAGPTGPALPLLPDDYARPAPVTIEQLLPFFLPAPPPVSRALHEIK